MQPYKYCANFVYERKSVDKINKERKKQQRNKGKKSQAKGTSKKSFPFSKKILLQSLTFSMKNIKKQIFAVCA